MPTTKQLNSINPATGEIIGSVTRSTEQDVVNAVQMARQHCPDWRETSVRQRQTILAASRQLLLQRRDEFAELITAEMGRPITESLVMEVQASLELIGYYAGHAAKMLKPERLQLHNLFFARRRSLDIKKPLGVIGVISPWNWPLLIPLGCIVPALLAGNCVVHKHSEHTPLINETLLRLFRDAGLPEGVFQIVHGAGEAGQALIDAQVDKLFFTGSTRIGSHVMSECSKNLIPVVLELGGQDATLVCADAHLETASSGLVWGAFMNAGQNCNAVERIYVHQSVADAFVRRFVEKTKRLRMGDPMNPEVDMGPLALKQEFGKMQMMLKSAQERGSIIRCGEHRQQDGHYFAPTVVVTETDQPNIWGDEVFGPLVSVTPVTDMEKAVQLANDNPFGLTASVWTRQPKAGETLAMQLETGTVMINDCIVSFGFPEAPWTGLKQSGIGWMHGKKGFEEMLSVQYINADRQFRRQKFWWFPYGERMLDSMQAGLTFLHSRNVLNKIKVVIKVIGRFWRELLLNRNNPDKL
ncbi:MAG: aldehyde dehydrogenase family protein [candidate division KSB1 bacterium]|nr:aldehyde dehydrogenase family protein [candidate division KSB1 bacterium]